MHTINVQQGTQEWHDLRRQYFTASQAPAMMGVSPYQSRDSLLQYHAYGIDQTVTEKQQRVFDRGHETEALARPIAEEVIGEDLFPVVGTENIDGLALMASFDGITVLEDTIWEHKQYNEKLFNQVEQGHIPEYIAIQLEHQLLVSGAEHVFFMVSDGTTDCWTHMYYYSSQSLQHKIIRGWKQFAEDLKNYKPQQHQEKPRGQATSDRLPALAIEITGRVTSSNLQTYKASAQQFIDAISTDLQTDQDFADAEQNVKACKKAEEALEHEKQRALNQTADISELLNELERIKSQFASKRKELDKQVKSRKEQIKMEIIRDYSNQLQEHIQQINDSLGLVTLPRIESDFAGALKNKRTINSLHENASQELAKRKIEANEFAEKIKPNLDTYDNIDEAHKHLFADLQQICTKEPEDFRLLVDKRISEFKAQQTAAASEEADQNKEQATEPEATQQPKSQLSSFSTKDEAATADQKATPSPEICEKGTSGNSLFNQFFDYLRRQPNITGNEAMRMATELANIAVEQEAA